MSGQILWVPTDVFRRADVLLRGTSSGQAVKEGIELILKCDLSVAGEDPGPGLGRVDASGLLTKGLASLQNNPHEALGVPIGAKTQDIRKAYKKAALRYHPDKNPKTTPLFQVIQVACDKLSDREERAKAQKNAAANPISGRAEKFPATRKDKSSQREPNGQNHQQQHEENLSRQYESIPQPRDNSEFEHYRATVNTDKAHNSHGFAKVQQDYHKQYKDTAKGARGHSDSSSEASKFRTDQRVTGVMHEIFVDAKLAAMTEVADQKQRSSDVTFEEEGRHHLKTDVVNAAATIIGTSIYDSSTTHSNNIQHPSSNHFAPESSYLHGISQKVPRAQVATQLPDSAKAVEPGGLSRQEKSLPAPGLKSVNSRFHSQQANNDHHIQPNGKRILVPLPVDLKAVNVTYSSVELEWKISDQFATPILIQLSWRKQIVNASWERATQLINGLKCKKNNLELSPDLGCTYEFRIRAIEDLPGGMLGTNFLSIFASLAISMGLPSS